MNKLYILEKRLAKLEKSLKLERTVGRGGAPSNAYLIWQFLREHPNSTSSQIKDNFPSSKRASISSMIVDCTKEDCIRKNGDRYTANPSYNWDDVGSLASTDEPVRPSLADIRNAEPENTDSDEEPWDDEEPEQPVLSLRGKAGEDAIINIINSKNNKRAHSATIALSFPNESQRAVSAKLNSMANKGLLNKDGSWFTIAQSNTAAEPEPRQRETTTRLRTSSVVANIWSSKINEIKAALDAGENINQTNDKGETPLTKAISSRKAEALDTIEYLLNHGADVNVKMPSGMPIVFRAVKADNGPLVKLLVEHGANPNEKYNNMSSFELCIHKGHLLNDFIRYTINEDTMQERPSSVLHNLTDYTDNKWAMDALQEVCDKYMHVLISGNDKYKKQLIGRFVVREYYCSNTAVILKSSINNNYFPNFGTTIVGGLDTATLNTIYDAVKHDISHLEIEDLQHFMKVVSLVCDRLNKSKDILNNFMTVDALKNIGNIGQIAVDAIRNNDVDLLTKIVKTGRTDACTSNMLGYVLRSDNRKITSLTCKLLKNYTFDEWDIDNIAKCNNEYLIEWFIDLDDENGAKLANKSYTSDTTRRILKDHDINMINPYTSNLSDKARLRTELNRLKRAIEADEFRQARDVLSTMPDILKNDEAIDMINDPKNDDSFTARELRKMIKDDDADKYDF